MFDATDPKSQGICVVITELRQYFLGMVRVREHALGRKLTYEEARRLCLDLFCPNDFLSQSLSVCRKNLDQGARPGSQLAGVNVAISKAV